MELKCWLVSKDTQSNIVSFIISGLTSWFSNTAFTLEHGSLDISTLVAFQTQLLIGWDTFLFGIVADQLIHCQQLHYKSSNSRKLGTRWGVQLVSKLWNIIYQLWMHRNNCLHETDIINILCGKELLKKWYHSRTCAGY